MKKSNKKEKLDEEDIVVVEEIKPLAPKLPISQFKPIFPNKNQFRGGQVNNMNSRQRPGRATSRGR